MKKKIFTWIFLSALLITAKTSQAQTRDRHEPAKWNLWLTDNVPQLPAPPDASKTKSEIVLVKKQLAARDDKKMAAITYWNAGAPAYRWNQIISKMAFEKPDVQLRMPGSWINIAIYDATVIAWREKLKYKRKRPAQIDPSIKPLVSSPDTYSYPCEHTVTASAAAHVLAYFFPAKGDSIKQVAKAASQSRIDAGVQFPSDADAAWKLGELVASQVIEKAKNDGSSTVSNREINKDPKKWTGQYALGINMVNYKTLVLKSVDQFRPAPPPDFTNEMNELKNFKQTGKTKFIAYYWANTADLWNELAGKKLFEYRMMDDAPAVARLYATLGTAYHEVAIAVMDAKYAYWGPRPDQVDTSFKPLIGTPPFPGYPSGHAAGAGTSASILAAFFPADAQQFYQIAQECADSRFYAGIHFRSDNEVGLQMGKEIGKYIFQSWMNKTIKK